MVPMLPVDSERLDTENSGAEVRVNRWLLIAIVVWLLLVMAGLGILMMYANQPGRKGEPAAYWPAASESRYSPSKSTLLVFAHPRCPCTRATVDELAWVMTRCRDSVDCRVLFVQPAGKSQQWVQGDVWVTASIPGVTVCADREGRLAEVFGAETSGHAMLFDSAGKLRFEGGITPSRGHRGSNLGREQIVQLAMLERPQTTLADEDEANRNDLVCIDSTCVFGCPLFSPHSSPHSSSSTSDLHSSLDP